MSKVNINGEPFTCLDCCQELGKSYVTFEDAKTLVNQNQVMDCTDCGMALVNAGGSCNGLLCNNNKHDKTPNWKRVWWWLQRTIKDLWYWLKCHTLPRYMFHKLDLRCTVYSYGWRDFDSRLLYATMNLLKDFVESEDGLDSLQYQVEMWRTQLENVESDATDETRKSLQETYEQAAHHFTVVHKAYCWWKTLDKNLYFKLSHGYDEESQEYINEIETMLIDIIKIRGYLWT